MYLFVEFKIKDHSGLIKEWGKITDHLPKGCRLFHHFFVKDHSHLFCLIEYENLNNLRNFLRDHFGMYTTMMSWEVDERHAEGLMLKRSA